MTKKQIEEIERITGEPFNQTLFNQANLKVLNEILEETNHGTN